MYTLEQLISVYKKRLLLYQCSLNTVCNKINELTTDEIKQFIIATKKTHYLLSINSERFYLYKNDQLIATKEVTSPPINSEVFQMLRKFRK